MVYHHILSFHVHPVAATLEAAIASEEQSITPPPHN
jgi:hypothetical protein